MFSRPTFLTLLFVCLIHAGLIAAVWINAPVTQSLADTQPTVEGVLISLPEPPAVQAPPPAVETPPPPPKKPNVPKPKPKPVEKPKPQPVKPKAAPPENAITPPAPPPSAPTHAPAKEPAPIATPTPEPLEEPVQEPRVDASRKQSLAPKYPTLSRRLREQGTVFLELLILADGSIAELRVKTSSGYERLDKAALAAVKNWYFVPARRGGEAIAYRYVQPIAFSLAK